LFTSDHFGIKRKRDNDLESSSERETEAGTEAEMEAETAFSFIGAVFSVRRTGDSVFLWEGVGDHCF
jgi:hypothetical protein